MVILKKLIALIALILWIAFVVITGNQTFVCNKTQNVCYSKVSGIKIGQETKISDVKNVKVGSTYTKLSGRGHRTTYSPELVTNYGVFYFYPTFVSGEDKAQQDINEFVNFVRSNQSYLELKNPCYFDVIDIFNFSPNLKREDGL